MSEDEREPSDAGEGASPTLTDEEVDLRRELIESAELDVPHAELGERIRAEIRRAHTARSGRRSRPGWAAVALAALVVTGVLFVLVSPDFTRREPVRLTAEPGPSLPVASTPARAAAAPTAPGACAHRRRASGAAPVIDDFEDANEAIAPLEGRLGSWHFIRDTDAVGTAPALVPERRPEPGPSNRMAAHLRGADLRDWGASLEFSFMPSCYDASAYAGVAFDARGPGRIYVSAREVRTIPVEWGGTCTGECYNVHQLKIDLGVSWQRFTVRWSDLRQRGYGMPPLDPATIHSMAFYVHAEDTPYDVWIDDVGFIGR